MSDGSGTYFSVKNNPNNPLQEAARKTQNDTNSKHRFTYVFLSSTAVFSNAIGSRKLSANEQCFVGAQTVVSLLQTIQMISHIYITHHVAYARIETELFFFSPGVDALGCFYSHISTRTFRRALTASLDSCVEIKSAPSVA